MSPRVRGWLFAVGLAGLLAFYLWGLRGLPPFQRRLISPAMADSRYGTFRTSLHRSRPSCRGPMSITGVRKLAASMIPAELFPTSIAASRSSPRNIGRATSRRISTVWSPATFAFALLPPLPVLRERVGVRALENFRSKGDCSASSPLSDSQHRIIPRDPGSLFG